MNYKEELRKAINKNSSKLQNSNDVLIFERGFNAAFKLIEASNKVAVINDKINFDKYLQTVNKVFDRSFKICSEKVKRQIRSRLKEGYNPENIYNAMINCYNSEHHKTTNYQYCTPEFFSRSSTLDKYGDKINKLENKEKSYLQKMRG